MQFLFSLILAAGGLASIVWCKTLGNLTYKRTQRQLVEGTFVGSVEIPNGPIGRALKTIPNTGKDLSRVSSSRAV